MNLTPTIQTVYYELRQSLSTSGRPSTITYPTNRTLLRYSRVSNPVHVVTLTPSIGSSSSKPSMSSTRRAQGAAPGTRHADAAASLSQNDGTDGSSVRESTDVMNSTTAATLAADFKGTTGSTEHEQTDCLNDVVINSVDLCGLADAQFVDRMTFDRKFQNAVTRRNNADYRVVTSKATGSTFQADGRRNTSFSSAPAASRKSTETVQKNDRVNNNGRDRRSRLQTDGNCRNFNRSKTFDDVVASSDTLQSADMQLDLPLCSELDDTAVGTENERLTSEEVTSLSSSSPRRAMLSFYDLRVWPEKEGPVGGSRRIPVYRAIGGETRINGNVNGGQKRSGDQQSSSPDEPSRQWTQIPRQSADRGGGNGTSVERIRTLRHSYPDDPILRRILGIGMQASTGQDPPRTAKRATFVNPAVQARVRTGSRRPGTDSSSRSALPSRGGRSLRKPEGPMGTTDGRGGIHPDTEAMSRTMMTGEHLATNQRSQRHPSVSLMFERSVTRIEPGWKTDVSLSLAAETNAAGSNKRDTNATSGLVAVFVEDDDVIVDTGVRLKSQKQSLPNEVDRQRINSSAAALLSIATSSSTPRPPCNSPDQQPDDYFWSDTVFRSADSQPAKFDTITAPATILSHSESRQSAAERFQRSRMLSTSRSSSGVSAPVQRPRRTYTSGVGAYTDGGSGGVHLQTPRSNTWFETPVGRYNNLNDNRDMVEQELVDLKRPPPPRLVVYVPH